MRPSGIIKTQMLFVLLTIIRLVSHFACDRQSTMDLFVECTSWLGQHRASYWHSIWRLSAVVWCYLIHNDVLMSVFVVKNFISVIHKTCLNLTANYFHFLQSVKSFPATGFSELCNFFATAVDQCVSVIYKTFMNLTANCFAYKYNYPVLSFSRCLVSIVEASVKLPSVPSEPLANSGTD